MPLQRLILVPENKGYFMCQNVEKTIKAAQANLGKFHKQQEIYYNMNRRVLDIKVGERVLLESHFFKLKSFKMNRKVWT